VELIRIVLDVLLLLLLLMTGGGKLAGAASSNVIRDSLNVPATRWKLIGVMEMLGVVGFAIGIWTPLAGAAAAVGVVALMIGAVITRVRGGEVWSVGVWTDAVVAFVAVAGIVLNLQAA
jgi:uncharacterized membrane protein YphA (DoxX/SURF4 family)